jgi:hypothetical protein
VFSHSFENVTVVCDACTGSWLTISDVEGGVNMTGQLTINEGIG